MKRCVWLFLIMLMLLYAEACSKSKNRALKTGVSTFSSTTGNCDSQGGYCNDYQTITTSGSTISIPSNGGMVITFDESETGAPATVSVVIQGCGAYGTNCENIDTNTTVGNVIRSPLLTKTYSKYLVTASWTGGTSVNVKIGTQITTASIGTGGTTLVPSGIVAQYKLSEGIGTTVYDSSPNALNTTWTGTKAGLSGYYSAGIVTPWAGFFNGTDDFIDAGTNAVLTPTGPFTITAWVYPAALTNAYSAIVQKGDATNYYELYVTSTGHISAFLATPAHVCASDAGGATGISVNTIHLFAMSYDGANTLLPYIDGQLNGGATGCGSGSLVASPNHFFIGKDAVTTGRQFNGVINDVRLYNRVLSVAEINTLLAQHN